MTISNVFRVSLVKLLRCYNMYFPLRRGHAFSERMICALRDGLKGDRTMILKCRGGDSFLVDFYEPQFHELLCFGTYEEAETSCARQFLRRGDTVLDIGANFGWYSILAARIVGGSGQVHAFEPIPLNYDYLENNRKLSPNGRMITTNNWALGDRMGENTFHLFAGSALGNASGLIAGRSVKESFVCKVGTVDAYLKETGIQQVDFIKCDVEGHELAVLKGSKGLLGSARPPAILIEINERLSLASGYHGVSLLSFLSEASNNRYVFYRIDPRSRRLVKHDGRTLRDALENVICVVPDVHGERLKG